MRHLANKLFGNFTLGILIICLQFFWLVYMLYNTKAANSAINIVFIVVAVLLSLHIANKEIRTAYKLSWIFLILSLPVFGIPAFFLFGRSELTRRTRREMGALAEEFAGLRVEDAAVREALKKESPDAAQHSKYITDYAKFPLYREEATEYFPSGEALFPRFLEDLKSAEQFIFLEYFIMEPGEMLDAIVAILEEKAKSGVLVRVIYDDVGCIRTLPPKYFRTFASSGIESVSFNPFRPFLSVIMNNRDHRKIAVVDGRIAYTGGFNLADEYINATRRFGYWKDAGIRMEGACVWSFTTMFLEMWCYITGKGEDCGKYHPHAGRSAEAAPAEEAGEEEMPAGGSKGYIQPYGDSPMDYEYVGENVYLNLINRARDYVYIFTPYLIPGSEMTTALVNAAKSGVDVRIMVPGIPDKKMVYLLTQSYFSVLIRGGVKIYRYTPGFVHSKCFVVDDVYAVVGTINLDYRSLCLHFECGAFLYRAHAVLQVKEDFLAAVEESHSVTAEEARNRHFFIRQFYGVLKLMAPLL
ncbi:MAG: cardiolipin synthase [Agathobacter sp.]|nr:cardiolipin synthase [Agathobacter sp.]